MSSDERVVIKSSWRTIFPLVAAVWFLVLVVVALVAVVDPTAGIALVITLLVAFPGVVVLVRMTAYVELTPLGLGIHGLSGTTTVPWAFIGSVDYVAKGSGGYLSVEDRAANRSRALPAPRVVFDMGEAEADEARSLIEQWRLAHRGPGTLPAEGSASEDATPRQPIEARLTPAVDFGVVSKEIVVPDHVEMPLDQRVVVRCSWWVCCATVVPLVTVLLIFQASTHGVGVLTFLLACQPVVVVLVLALDYLELTPQGLRIHGYRGGTTVPWISVGAVDYVPVLGGTGHLKVRDLAAKRRRRLTAPRVVFGMGKDEMEHTRELIQLWRLAFTQPIPVTAAHPAPVPPVVDLGLA